MSFRFWRRIRLAPGVTLNLSKSMASLSIGPQGAKYTISPRGNRATAGSNQGFLKPAGLTRAYHPKLDASRFSLGRDLLKWRVETYRGTIV